MQKHFLAAALTLSVACSGNTSSTVAPAATTTAVAMAEVDVPGADSIRAVVRDVYDVISGPAGQRRDWDRMRSMFAPNARLSAMIPRRAQNDTVTAPHPNMVMMSVEDYIARSGPYLEREGFFENEVYSEIERYGNVAHVWSTYESRATPDAAPFDRGINSFQLVFGDGRWWVYSILWHSERSGGGTIPDRYLD